MARKKNQSNWWGYVLLVVGAALLGYLYKSYQHWLTVRNMQVAGKVSTVVSKVNDVYTAGTDILKILGIIKK